jgi:hypothetical protein
LLARTPGARGWCARLLRGPGACCARLKKKLIRFFDR